MGIQSTLINVATLAADWDVTSFLKNLKTTAMNWGGLVLMLLGAIGVAWGAGKIIIGLLSKQHVQQEGGGSYWIKAALLLVIGGAFLTGGWKLAQTIASGGQKTIEGLGSSSGGAVGTMLMMAHIYSNGHIPLITLPF